jgi:hypothetical protein
MFRYLLCLSVLFFGTLAAESIDNIEFQLPVEQGWNVEDEVVNSCGIAQIYIAEDDPYVDTFELFSAQLFHVPYVYVNPEEFGLWMQIAFPFLDLQCNLIECNEDSTIIEIFGYDDGELEVYSIFNRIRSEQGTVLLSYSTDKELGSDENRNRWIQFMLDAKPIAH